MNVFLIGSALAALLLGGDPTPRPVSRGAGARASAAEAARSARADPGAPERSAGRDARAAQPRR